MVAGEQSAHGGTTAPLIRDRQKGNFFKWGIEMPAPKKNKKPIDVVFADRVILTLSSDVAALVETVTRIKAQMDALATERGVHVE